MTTPDSSRATPRPPWHDVTVLDERDAAPIAEAVNSHDAAETLAEAVRALRRAHWDDAGSTSVHRDLLLDALASYEEARRG